MLSAYTEQLIRSSCRTFLDKDDNIKYIELLPQSGSNRQYARCLTSTYKTFIATYNTNEAENATFVYLSRYFKKKKLPVPKILFYDAQNPSLIIQEDVGKNDFLSVLQQRGFTKHNKSLYQHIIHLLVDVQLTHSKGISWHKLFGFKIFHHEVVLHDLFYFKHFFLDAFNIPYENHILIHEFFVCAEQFHLKHARFSKWYGFMYRDFQSRNIMIDDQEQIRFIDYQGGMQGPIQYDIVSLIFQAKANLPPRWKRQLLDDYERCVHDVLGEKFDTASYQECLSYCFVIRQCQVLGAYGRRGMMEQKPHFINSIFWLLKQLKMNRRFVAPLNKLPAMTALLNTLEKKETQNAVMAQINKKTQKH